MSARPTRTPPRALSEADELDMYLEERDTWLSTEVRNSACQIRSDAPWIQFLDARYRLLLAYQAAERACQPDEPDGTLVPLRQSFLHLTRGLDRIMTPIEYWSDRPHEALEGEGRHARLVKGLDELAAALAMCGCSRIGSAALAQLIMTLYTLIAARYARPRQPKPLVALGEPRPASRCQVVSAPEIGSLRPQELSKYARVHALDLTLERQSSQSPTALPPHHALQSPAGAKMTTRTSLLSLPNEVIRMIFEELFRQERNEVPYTLICRRVRPLAEEILYKEIQRSSVSEHWFLRLARTFASRPDLRQLVRTFDVPGQPRSVEFRENGKMLDYEWCHLVAAEYLLVIFPLPACTSLSLQSVQLDMLDALVTEPSLPASMPFVKRLSLSIHDKMADARRPGWATAGLDWWPHLAKWPVLEDLSIGNGLLASPAAQISLAGIRRLSLGSDIAPPFFAPASVTFPKLRDLSLSGLNRNNHVHHILSTTVPELEQLRLDKLETSLAAELYVASFPKLVELRLCRGFSRQRLLALLASSRIRHIAFDHKCRVTDEFLLALLSGPSHMPNLSGLERNYVSASIGDELYGVLSNGMLPITAISEIREDEDESRGVLGPEWPDDCTADGLRAIADLAESAGIALSGSAMRSRAWEWDAAFDEQYEKYLVRSALIENKFDGLIEFYRSDQAGQAIVRHAPGLAQLVFSAMQYRSSRRRDGVAS